MSIALLSPTELERTKRLNMCVAEVWTLLDEKKQHYGQAGGFYETNSFGQYIHALGEVRLKLNELTNKHSKRALLKAITWLYLIYETEERLNEHQPHKD